MKTIRSLSRRAFLSTGAQATVAVCFTATSLKARDSKSRSFVVEAVQVRGLAVNAQGQMAVAADNGILFYGADGRLERKVAAGRPVRAVGFDARGRLFVARKDQVARLRADGTLDLLGAPLGGQEPALTSLALAENGDIYAADSGERLVWRLDATGQVIRQIKPSENGFSVPRGCFPIAWHHGQLLAADPGRHQVQTYSPNGKLDAKWGERSRALDGFTGCCNPVSVITLADGTVVTAERGQPRVKAFDAAGRLSRVLAGPEEFEASMTAAHAEAQELSGCQAGILDLAAGPAGEIIVLDRTTREIRVLA
jgi:hypothetical protein